MTRKKPVRIGIYGSCVSRDTIELLPKDSRWLVFYVARCSAATLARPAPVIPPDVSQLSSPFQQRMVTGDSTHALLSVIADTRRVERVLWDLADERLGVLELADGSLLTNSSELQNSGALERLSVTRCIDFGSSEHLDLFRVGAERVVHALGEARLARRTALLDVPFARKVIGTVDQTSRASIRERADAANAVLPAYVDVVRGLGIRVESIEPEVCAADPDHRWGLAPFHYSTGTYDAIIERFPTLHRRRDAEQCLAEHAD